MATKVTVIGSKARPKELKPIEFCSYFNVVKGTCSATALPGNYNYIELICLNYQGQLDLMFAYADASDRNDGALYLGKFNDGVVEE